MDSGFGLDQGIMVAERDGDVHEQEEQPGHAEGRQEEIRTGVAVNPFWSQKAQDEAVLRASRPSGLPPVGTDEKPREEGALREEPGGGGGRLEGRDQQIGMHPEATSNTVMELYYMGMWKGFN